MRTHLLIALIVWMIISLILTLSIVGMIVWVRADNNTLNWQGDEGRSTWAKIGQDLSDRLIKKG